MCYRKQKGSGTPIAVAFAEGGMRVAAAAAVVAVEVVVQLGMCARVPGCMAIVVALELVGESDTVHAAAP